MILLAEIERPQDAAHVAEKVLAVISEPQLIDGIKLQVSVSIGVSVYPDDGDDVTALMRCADTAMYQAKASGCSSYRFFGAGMPSRATGRVLMFDAGARAGRR